MTTEQQFFLNIINFNAVSFETIDKTVGDLNKNVGLSANLIDEACQILGNSITAKYDLPLLLGDYSTEISSENSEVLLQSLQNTTVGIASSTSYPTFNVSTHMSTKTMDYTASMSSAFLSGQIYSFPAAGIFKTSVISIAATQLSIYGNQFNSHLFDAPIDLGVFGVNNFNGSTYTGASLIQFDYSWSYAQSLNLLIKLNFSTSLSNYYLTFYWGTSDFNFISTNYSIGTSIIYAGNNNFINSIGILTTSVSNVALIDFSGRKNFWDYQVPYSIQYEDNFYIESTPYLWAKDRANRNLIDGVPAYTTPPDRYPILNGVTFSSILTSTSNYAFVFADLSTNGIKESDNISANTNFYNLFSSNIYVNVDQNNINKDYNKFVPLSLIVFQKNPKKYNLNFSNGYSIINYAQIVPSAFIKSIEDINIWTYFSKNLIKAKNYYKKLNKIVLDSVNSLDNFIASFLFGINIDNVSSYYQGDTLIVTTNTLKNFMQPHGFSDIDPINLSEYQEKSIYAITNIIPSKEYVIYDQGRLYLYNTKDLPNNNSFEIFKPLSIVCNGVDPFDQGVGLALDYTINFTFNYNNQNTLYKTLFLMASKYLISQSDYEDRINLNQDIFGYYYLADPLSNDNSPYSVSSIEEFRLYGYSGIIPDLKDGVVRPILTKVFSPSDNSKYTYEQFLELLASQGITNIDDINNAVQKYLDAGNTFIVIDLNTHSNKFINISDFSICATNYALNTTKYWNDSFFDKRIFADSFKEHKQGFTNLLSQIISNISIKDLFDVGVTTTIYNIPVGFDCSVIGITANSLGSNLIPGTYQSWIKPSSIVLTDEQPALIKYKVLSSGVLDTNSIQILNPGGNFYFDFDIDLSDIGFTTTIGTSYANIHVNLDNIARFTASVTGGTLTQFTQSSAPPYGYLVGFHLNNGCFYGLGYTATVNVNILINNYPTDDSFLISNRNLNAGDLEYYGTFTTPQSNLSAINYLTGSQIFTLFDKEIFNSISLPINYGASNLSFIIIYAKLIEMNNLEPAGYITAHIYEQGSSLIKVASSEKIYVKDLSRYIYTSVVFPIKYTFEDISRFSQRKNYWVSIENNLENSFLNIKGTLSGITTSNFSIGSSLIYNDGNPITIFGGINSGIYDLDLGISTIGISSLFGSNIISIGTSLINILLRKNSDYKDTNNQLTLRISTTYNSETNYIFSNPVSIASLTSTFTGISFTFNSKIYGSTVINNSELIFSKPIIKDRVFMARSLSQYSSQIGIATSSLIGISNTNINFNFIFNKLFGQISNKIYASFNNTTKDQFGLANPNRLREIDTVNIVDGYWAFSGGKINASISLYPRAFISNNSAIGTSAWQYQYLGFSHDIYVNIGYNSNSIYKEELIILNAYPKWKTTWMSRDNTNYKDFNIFNTVAQTYIDSIYYHIGLASTTIGITTGPKVAIFEGTFKPSGSLNEQVPIIFNIGTSAGIQVYINGSSAPIIDTFSVLSSGSTTVTGLLNTEIRQEAVQFKVLYYTLATASIEAYWNIIGINSLINATNSMSVGIAPTNINNSMPVDELIFLNVSKTYEEAISINNGYPIGDSFVIRSS